VLAAVALPPAPVAAQADDDFLELATLSFRASRSYAVAYHVRADSAGTIRCSDMVVYREATRVSAVQAAPDFQCDGPAGAIPVQGYDGKPGRQWTFLPTFVQDLTFEVRVEETRAREIAGMRARCFEVTDVTLAASICIDPKSSVVLMLDGKRGNEALTMTASRVSARALPEWRPKGDLRPFLDLLMRGMETSYTIEFASPDGKKSVAARDGGSRDYVASYWPATERASAGSTVEIHDGARRISCTIIPDVTTGECRLATTQRLQQIGSVLVWKILGDPEPEAVELAPRVLLDRPARCFELRSWRQDDVSGTWARLVREVATICLDRELGAVLFREVLSPTVDRLVASRFVPTADAELFRAPYPITRQPRR
jgi:hypothetical protein